jgi:hypothetical protein
MLLCCLLLKDVLPLVSDFIKAKGLIKGYLANGFFSDEDEKKRYKDAENLVGHHHLSDQQQSERDWFNRFSRRINLLMDELKLECYGAELGKSPKKKLKMVEDSISAESGELKKAKVAEKPTPIAMKFAPSMMEAFAGTVCKKDKHIFVAGGELATVIKNNLPRGCSVLPPNDPLLLSGDAPETTRVISLELLEPHQQFKEILTMYDTLEDGCRFSTIITLAAYLSPKFADKVQHDWSKSHEVLFIPYSSPNLTLSETHLWFFGVKDPLPVISHTICKPPPKQSLFDDEAEEVDDDDIDDRGDVEDSSIDSEL